MTGKRVSPAPPGPDETAEDSHLTKGLLRLSLACDEGCLFCNVPPRAAGERAPSLSDLHSELDRFIASGARTLTISGGEPTLFREPLVQLVARARSLGVPFVELQTNALRLDESYAAELAAAGLTSAFVALLAHEAPLHDELMGRPGAHSSCLRGIDALHRAGVAVTLNPVITRPLADRVAEYVDFVAARLPAVKTISLSVVQPHGRAAAQLDLLPDYAVLGPAVRRARARGEVHGIELLNPYCGLPVCVGWQDGLDRCVEAGEAEAAWQQLGHAPFGLHNDGSKRQGAPCRGCALRTRCGGAWHAYWTHRGGRGLQAPQPRLEPWEAGAGETSGQTVVEADGEVDDATLAQLSAARAPTVWLFTSHLEAGDARRIARAGCTDLAILSSPRRLCDQLSTARELRQLARLNAGKADQSVIRTAVALAPDGSFADCFKAVRLAVALPVDAVRLLAPPESRWRRFVAALQAELPDGDIELSEIPAP